MIIYSGEGYLALVFFMVPVVVVGAVLYYGFGIDILRSNSWWPLHSIMMMGAILTFAIGSYLNRSMVEEITYEKSGPVTKLKPRHTFYYVPLEYWGPIVLAIYFGLVAYHSFK
jgi:hypothetical protein